MKKVIILIISLIFFTTITGCKTDITSTGDNVDRPKLQMEDEYFKFYSFNKDTKCLNDLAKTLEDNYNRISKDLRVELKDKLEIEIYPDIESYHNAVGTPNAPNRSVGTGWGNKIKTVSPLNPGGYHTYDTLMKVVVHEFTHVAVSNINSNLDSIPIWLSEGIAIYEAKQMTSNDKSAIKEKIDKEDIPSLFEMTQMNISEVCGYAFSYTAIEYLIKNYGYDTLITLIKTPSNLENILGINNIEFENKWKSYLMENYK